MGKPFPTPRPTRSEGLQQPGGQGPGPSSRTSLSWGSFREGQHHLELGAQRPRSRLGGLGAQAQPTLEEEMPRGRFYVPWKHTLRFPLKAEALQ